MSNEYVQNYLREMELLKKQMFSQVLIHIRRIFQKIKKTKLLILRGKELN